MKKSFLALSLTIAVGFFSAVTLCVRALATAQPVSAFDEGGMRVVVDAGHGGIDGGVTGRTTGVKESDINLAIAHRLREELSDMGFEVTMTRKTEAGLYGTTAKGFKKRDMQRRKEIIEEAQPDLVISVHQNFYPSKTSRGGQVFYSKASDKGKALALAVQAELNELYLDKGVKGRNAATGEFFMLECYDCPSVIVECGFLSNPTDEAFLVSEIGQGKVSEAIAAGIMGYLSGSFA